MTKESSYQIEELLSILKDGFVDHPQHIIYYPERTKPGPSKPDPIPGRQRFTKGGFEGVPQYGLNGGHDIKLRDKADPNDPATQPGPVTVRKIEGTTQ